MTTPTSLNITDSIFILQFAERPKSGDAKPALIGPSVHSTEGEALEKLWEYVASRIIETCYDEFMEVFCDNCEEPIYPQSFLDKLSNEGLSPEGEALSDHFKEYLLAEMGEMAKKAIDWYFDFMNDELFESFYTIDQHSIPCDKNMLPGFEGSYYEWLDPNSQVDGVQFGQIEGDEYSLSEFMYPSVQDAAQVIHERTFDHGPDEAKDFVLVKVEKSLVDNPFK